MMTYQDFKELKTVHVDSLYDEKNKWRCFKNTSIASVLPEISLQGDWAQFGVFKGESARLLEGFCRGVPDRKLYLFDSFEGLPEGWADTGLG